MKIRIKGNSLRYRLTKSEVSTLAHHGALEDKTHFAGNLLTYAVKSTSNSQLSAELKDYILTLHVPEKDLKKWAFSDEVGLENIMALNSGDKLYLLIEKDFKCIDVDESEDQSDYYENPNLTC